MASVAVDKHGSLDYTNLVASCAGVLTSLTNVSQQRQLADQVEEMRGREDYGLVLGRSEDEMRAALDGAFRSADGGGAGVLQMSLIADIVVDVLGVSENQLQAVMSLAAPDDEGTAWYDDVSDWAHRTLEYLESGQHQVLSSPRGEGGE